MQKCTSYLTGKIEKKHIPPNNNNKQTTFLFYRLDPALPMPELLSLKICNAEFHWNSVFQQNVISVMKYSRKVAQVDVEVDRNSLSLCTFGTKLSSSNAMLPSDCLDLLI